MSLFASTILATFLYGSTSLQLSPIFGQISAHFGDGQYWWARSKIVPLETFQLVSYRFIIMAQRQLLLQERKTLNAIRQTAQAQLSNAYAEWRKQVLICRLNLSNFSLRSKDILYKISFKYKLLSYTWDYVLRFYEYDPYNCLGNQNLLTTTIRVCLRD